MKITLISGILVLLALTSCGFLIHSFVVGVPVYIATMAAMTAILVRMTYGSFTKNS